MDLASTLISAIAGILGALVGAYIVWFTGNRQRRRETVFDMHREFNSPDFTKSRGPAGATVRRHSDRNYEQMRKALPLGEMQHVWNVMYFYQRLWLAIKYEHVDVAYVPGMFGENFLWWWINSYAKQLAPKDKEGSGRGPQVPENPEGGPPPVVPPKLNWEAARHISALKKWIDDKAADNEDLAGDLKLWEKRAAELGEPTPEATGKTTTSRHPLRRRPKLRGPTRCYPV